MPPQVVSDNASPAELGPEPSGYWDPVHAAVDALVAKYTDGQEDDGEPD